jgi:hypothetical protein
MLARPPSHNALRQRRFRQRQRRHEVMVTISLTPAETSVLHRLGYLALDQLEDRAAIADAVRSMLGNIKDV